MNEITLLPADNYVVVNKTILTDNDKHNLLAYFKTSTNSKEILKLSI